MATMELIDRELIRDEFAEEYAYELAPEEEKALRRGEEDYRNGRWITHEELRNKIVQWRKEAGK